MDITNLQGPLKKEVDMDTSMVSGGNSPGREEFDNFCKEFHKNAVFNGNLTMVMTLQMEENLIKYLLHPQETVSYSEMTHWLENFVFCVVSNDDENSCELHIWNDGQKRVISLENYYSLLTILYSEENFKTLEDFTKKINEQYALIPEGIIKYFFNLQTRKKSLFQPQNKENGHYRCKVTSYEYVKKTILKRRILTEVTNTLNGKVVASNCQEEDAVDEDLYSVEKTERVCEIINNEVNELSCMSYPSNQFLEVKYGGKKSLVLFPQNERQNQEHLLTLSSVLYSACATPQKTGEVQLEFAIPHKPPKRAVDIDVLGTFSNKNEKTLNVTLSEQKPKKKPVKELKGKLSIVSNPVTKGATLKCVENNSLNVSPLKHSYSELAAAASPSLITNIPGEVESIHNFMDGVANIFDDDNDHSPNINNEVQNDADTGKSPVKVKVGKGQACCPECRKVIRKKNLKGHMARFHSTSRPDIVLCNVCNVEVNHNDYKDHMMIHQAESVAVAQKAVADYNAGVYEKPTHYLCPTCGMKLKAGTSYYVHMRRHKNIHYKCEICGKEYKDKSTLDEHINLHKGVLPYKCEKCDQSFPSAHKRSVHMIKEHVPKRFACDICNRWFRWKPNLVCHRRTHTGERPFPCELCPKKFINAAELQRHTNIHNGVFTHFCPVCGKGFVQKGNMMSHAKSHSKVKSERAKKRQRKLDQVVIDFPQDGS